MILKQFYLDCLAHASYLVVDEKSKTAAVIDPQRDIAQYLEEAERHGATIRHVLLTHFHADFVAGHIELQQRVGATIYLGAAAKPEYDFVALGDGDELEFGELRLRALETPGHTPESLSLLLFDLAKSEVQPEAVFTGDTLFVGDVGRPDLMASVGTSAKELGGWLYDSLHKKLLTLPDVTTVYPAHGAGSMCGKNLGSETFTTIGDQRQNNYALQPMSKPEFIDLVTADQPEAPSYFGYDAVMNQRKRATLDENLAQRFEPLDLEAFLQLRQQGRQLVDVRDPNAFARAHFEGSINIGLDGKFATWAGTLLDRETDIILVAEPGTEQEAALRLGRIGLDRVAGFLKDGPATLALRRDLLQTTERIGTMALAARLVDDAAPPLVVDVRAPREWESGHIEGSINLPLPHLLKRAAELPTDRDLAVVCRSGYRSSAATSLLQGQGVGRLLDTVGGMLDWEEHGLPTTVLTPPSCQA